MNGSPPWPTSEEIDGCFFGASTAELLKARAAEMLAYVHTEEAVEGELLEIRHRASCGKACAPRLSTRTSSITTNAPEEMDRLRGRVSVEDVPLVGLPRFTCRQGPAGLRAGD